MASLMGRIARLARGPQGRRLAEWAQSYVSSPEGQRRIRELRGRLGRKR
jgi:hypothetical protein